MTTSAEYTPQPAHISPPSSITPTRHGSQQNYHQHQGQVLSSQPPLAEHHSQQHYHPSQFQTQPFPPPQSHSFAHLTQGHLAGMTDFSPSSYLNHDAYAQSDSTGYDSGPASASSSLSIPQSATMPEYEFYPDFTDFVPIEPTKSADESSDRTPVVSDQKPIPPSSFPAPPRGIQAEGQETVRPKTERQQAPLMSPFRQYPGQPAPPTTASMDQVPPGQQMMNAGQMYYVAPGGQVPPGSMMYPPAPEGMVPAFPAHYMPVQPHPSMAQMYAQPGQYYPQHRMIPSQQGYDFGPPRSRNASPTSSISSSAVSLTRSTSTCSDLRQPRPKVKLSWEDKRNIVELHRSNSSLRQEDIARQYGVDRSTISKIILSSHRWTQPQEVHVPAVPKVAKSVGGRFPAIEAKMDQWMDEQIAAGLDVRDNVARDKAKEFAREMNFSIERFKASAKWLDKWKDRRKAAGKTTSAPGMSHYGYYPYTTAPYPEVSAMNGSVVLSRSQSAVTLSSSDSSGQDMFQPSPIQHMVPTPQVVTPHQMPLTRSETDLINFDTTPSSRQRSQSSPHLLGEPGHQSPSSGKASRFVRPSPLNLQRQNSFHGTSPSPRRPQTLIRSNTSQGAVFRRARPTSLAASAFGITPIVGADQLGNIGSPMHSPTTSTGTHSRQHSDASLAPFTSSMGGMTISPTLSDNGAAGVQPITPITPGHGPPGGVFPTQDYSQMDASSEFGVQQSRAHSANAGQPVQYATMPNKHYAPQYVMPQGYSTNYGQVPHLEQQVASNPAWQ